MSSLAARFGAAFQQRVAWLVGRPWFWAVFIPLLFAYPLFTGLSRRLPERLPIIAQVPSFSLIDERGEPFGSRELEGRIWVGSFFFTRCTTVCPRVSEKMAQIRHRGRNLAGALHLVSFSVDPEFDTPETLRAYAKRYRQSPGTWTFLTGPLDAIRSTVVDGLRTSMGNDGPPGTYDGIFHGSHFVVVDPHGRIRAYIDANDDDAVDRVMRAVSTLALPDDVGGEPVRAKI